MMSSNHLIQFLFLRLSSFAVPTWAAIIGGMLVTITLTLSAFLLLEHLKAYKNPEEQKFLIGVILMVPCYSIESYISLVNPSISVFCEILRDGYEAFAMYCFVRYLVACLGGEERTLEFMEKEGFSSSTEPLLPNAPQKGIVKHPFPMNYMLKPWKVGREFYQLIKIGIVQYMIIKSFTAVLAVVLQAFGVYCEGEFKWNCGYTYIEAVLNFSQSWALYCLVHFYTVIKDELAHIQPLAKFLVFKSIVFLTWWQGLLIAIFSYMGWLKSPIAQELQFQSSIQDFIICIEMGIASAVHLYVFPSKPYKLMGDRFPGIVSVLGDYASVDCPVDPDEVRDSERPTKLRLPHPEIDSSSATAIKESVRDVVLGGGEYIVNDVKFTVTHAVEPMEKGLTRFNQKIHNISQNIKRQDKDRKRTKDDSCIASPPRRVIRGIDDPLLNGSFSDSMVTKGRRNRKKSSYINAESGGESSDQGRGKYETGGNRWITRE